MRILVAIVLGFITGNLIGQEIGIAQTGSPIISVELIEMPRQNNIDLTARSRSVEPERAPKVFASPIVTKINYKDKGSLERVEGDNLLWRLRIRSEGAYSLNLGFKDFFLPPSASLFLYDMDKTHVVGPIKARDNDDHGEWWSPILPFDEVVIEIQMSADEFNDLRLEVSQVNHDFSGLGRLLSGSCNVDVMCSQQDGFGFIDDYRDIIQSVGFMTISGFELCSGYLVNNVRNDCTPYFMTAFHCDVTVSNGPSVVVYWNYQNSFCRMPDTPANEGVGDGELLEFNSGAQNIAGDDSLDFRLILLDDEVNSDFNPFFAGWNAEGEVFDTTYCIHHPDGEEKRISADFGTPTFYAEEFFIRIQNWELGTTEGGSSGSPLFSKNKKVIGMLSGGTAACGNSGFDDYSSMKLAWEGIRGTPETRLKDWLDPDDSGLRILDGRYCSQTIGVDRTTFRLCTTERTSDTVFVSILSGFETGATISVSESSPNLNFELSNENITPEEGVEVIFTIGENFTGDSGQFTILAEEGGLSSEVRVNILLTSGKPSIPTPAFPTENMEFQETSIEFFWTGDGTLYDLQIVKDTSLLDGLLMENISGTSFLAQDLDSGNDYYWRIMAINNCGKGPYSAFQLFSILDITCLDFQSNHNPIVISEVPDTVVSSIFIEETTGKITDLNVVNILGRHTYISDLRMELTSPAGTTVILVEYPCNDDDDYQVSFDDESNLQDLECPLNEGKTFVSEERLSAFDGESPSGEWVLKIFDDFNADGGNLISWGLNMCLDQAVQRSVTFTPPSLDLCEKDTGRLTLEVELSQAFQVPLNISITDVNGQNLGATIEPSSGSGSQVIFISFGNEEKLFESDQLLFIVQDDLGIDTFELAVNIIGGPSTASLTNPEDQSVDVDRKTSFSWEINDDVDKSRLLIFSDENMSEVVLDTTVKADDFTLSFRLEKNSVYYWYIETVGECSNTLSGPFSFTTELSVATKDLLVDEILIYPNPARNEVFIELSEAIETRVVLRSILGQSILRANSSEKILRLDLQGLEVGVYFLEIEVSNRRGLYKVFVNP